MNLPPDVDHRISRPQERKPPPPKPSSIKPILFSGQPIGVVKVSSSPRRTSSVSPSSPSTHTSASATPSPRNLQERTLLTPLDDFSPQEPSVSFKVKLQASEIKKMAYQLENKDTMPIEIYSLRDAMCLYYLISIEKKEQKISIPNLELHTTDSVNVVLEYLAYIKDICTIEIDSLKILSQSIFDTLTIPEDLPVQKLDISNCSSLDFVFAPQKKLQEIASKTSNMQIPIKAPNLNTIRIVSAQDVFIVDFKFTPNQTIYIKTDKQVILTEAQKNNPNIIIEAAQVRIYNSEDPLPLFTVDTNLSFENSSSLKKIQISDEADLKAFEIAIQNKDEGCENLTLSNIEVNSALKHKVNEILNNQAKSSPNQTTPLDKQVNVTGHSSSSSSEESKGSKGNMRNLNNKTGNIGNTTNNLPLVLPKQHKESDEFFGLTPTPQDVTPQDNIPQVYNVPRGRTGDKTIYIEGHNVVLNIGSSKSSSLSSFLQYFLGLGIKCFLAFIILSYFPQSPFIII